MKDMKGMEQIPDFAAILVSSVPAIMAFWSVIAMVLNLYLAMKVVRISGLFHGQLPVLRELVRRDLQATLSDSGGLGGPGSDA